MKHSPQPIDVFISYKREDGETAKALAEALAHRGYSVWWDVDLLPGERFADAIMEVIKRAKATIVLWSKASVASGFVRAEATAADGLARLIPARLDACELPLPFNVLHTHDLTNWRAGMDETLLAPLFKAVAGRTGKAPTAPEQPAAAAENLHSQDRETLLWRALAEQKTSSPKEYELFLAKYPNGIFAELARLRLEALHDGRLVPPSSAHNNNFLAWLVRPIVGATYLFLVVSFPQAPLPPEAALSIAFPLALLLGAILGAIYATLMLTLYIGVLYFNVQSEFPRYSPLAYDYEFYILNFLSGGIVVAFLAGRGYCRTISSSIAAFGISAWLALLFPVALLFTDTTRGNLYTVMLTVVMPSTVLIVVVASAIGWMNSRKSV